jgi:hypothetical protein
MSCVPIRKPTEVFFHNHVYTVIGTINAFIPICYKLVYHRSRKRSILTDLAQLLFIRPHELKQILKLLSHTHKSLVGLGSTGQFPSSWNPIAVMQG